MELLSGCGGGKKDEGFVSAKLVAQRRLLNRPQERVVVSSPEAKENHYGCCLIG